MSGLLEEDGVGFFLFLVFFFFNCGFSFQIKINLY